MSIQRIIEYLNEDSTHNSGACLASLGLPFDVNPTQYIDYAEHDLQEESAHSAINALANAKRALDCQLENLLHAFMLKDRAKKQRLNIPRKLDLLETVGILTPRILRKLNRSRNLIEHEFMRPEKEEVEDFVDVAALFIESTKFYVLRFLDELQFDKDMQEYPWLFVRFDHSNKELHLRFTTSDDEEDNFVLSPEDDAYFDLVRALVKAVYPDY